MSYRQQLDDGSWRSNMPERFVIPNEPILGTRKDSVYRVFYEQVKAEALRAQAREIELEDELRILKAKHRGRATRPVGQFNYSTGKLINEFKSITDAAEAVNRPTAAIATVIGKSGPHGPRSCAGYIWKYMDAPPPEKNICKCCGKPI